MVVLCQSYTITNVFKIILHTRKVSKVADSSSGIGTLSEWSLHASLKEHYCRPEDQIEVTVDGFVVDIVRENLLIEIQTTNFGAMKKKLRRLLPKSKVRIVYPIAQKKLIIRESLDGSVVLGQKYSPKRGTLIQIFEELVYIPFLAKHENFSLEAVLIEEIERKRKDGRGSWRRKGWSIVDRELKEIIQTRLFEKPTDYLDLLPDIESPFTNSEIAKALKIPVYQARKMTYTMRKMQLLKKEESKGRALSFSIKS